MTDAPIKLTYDEPQLLTQDPHITRKDTIPFTALTGRIRRVTVLPDWTPRQFILEEQFAIYKAPSGNVLFYVYDFGDSTGAGAGWYGVRVT